MPDPVSRDHVATDGGCIIVDKRPALSQAPGCDLQTLAQFAQGAAPVRACGQSLADAASAPDLLILVPMNGLNTLPEEESVLRTKPVALATRLYLLGIGIAGGLWGLALAFPQIPAAVVLATVGVVFLACASWAHRHGQREADGPVSRDDEERRNAAIRAVRPVPSVNGAAMISPSLPVSPR